MKITKDRIHSWEQVYERDYEKKFDDELIILLEPDETSREMGDYILECQKRSEWLGIIEDLIGEKIMDNHSLGILLHNIKTNRIKSATYDAMSDYQENVK